MIPLEDHFKYLFHILDLFIMTLLSSLFIKGVWFSLTVFDFVSACFSKVSEKISVNLEYESSAL